MTDEEIDAILWAADKEWNMLAISQAILGCCKQDNGLTMAKFEERLRAIGSKTTYLVARPASTAPKEAKVLHLITLEPAEYWLWICVNGPDDMLRELQHTGMTIEQNKAALAVTGVLVKQ